VEKRFRQVLDRLLDASGQHGGGQACERCGDGKAESLLLPSDRKKGGDGLHVSPSPLVPHQLVASIQIGRLYGNSKI
jgi:hypothetical protein